MSERNRRFTDREVALVLRKASEIDEAASDVPSAGLSLDDLTEIAAEVGISRTAIVRAVASLDQGRAIGPGLLGAPTVRKAASAVPRSLDEAGIATLVRLVDERTDAAGTVSEALGSVRWTSSDRFRSTRVSITPADEATSIEVVEKTVPRLRIIFHALPAAWMAMLAGPLVAALQLPGPGVLAAAAGSVLTGAALGRAAWNFMSVRSGHRVRRLAEGLADAADTLPHAPGRAVIPDGDAVRDRGAAVDRRAPDHG